MKALTETQKAALTKMEDRNLGAILVANHGWVSTYQVRTNEEKAAAVLARLTK